MSTVTGQNIASRYDALESAKAMLWETITETNDRGSGFEWPLGADVSVHVFGTFGGDGGTIKIEGSNTEDVPADDSSDWAIMDDAYGNKMSFTAKGLIALGPVARWIRPIVTAGTGIDVDVILLARRR